MIVAVTGGRDYRDRGHVWRVLDQWVARNGPISLLVHGACPTGVDRYAAEWADARRIRHTGTKYAANWQKHGDRAGPIRNRAMLFHERPSVLIAFPGGRGTLDCKEAAKELLIEVLEVS